MGSKALSEFRIRPILFGVHGQVLGIFDALEVLDRVVQRVAILVMDVKAFRNRAAKLLPHVPVQVDLDLAPIDRDAPTEVPLITESLAFWVAGELVAVESDVFHGVCFSMISPCCSSHTGTKPRLAV